MRARKPRTERTGLAEETPIGEAVYAHAGYCCNCGIVTHPSGGPVMNQVIQDVRTGGTEIRGIPVPAIQRGEVLVATVASAISAGTERFVVDLARKSLIGKVRQRPD